MMRMINFLVGFMVGLVIGGAVATLLAPRSGVATRGYFQSRFESVLEEGRQAAERTRAEAHARLSNLKAK